MSREINWKNTNTAQQTWCRKRWWCAHNHLGEYTHTVDQGERSDLWNVSFPCACY